MEASTLPRAGIRELLELTMISAVLFAILMASGGGEQFSIAILLAGAGIVTGYAIFSATAGFLGQNPNQTRRLTLFVSGGCAAAIPTVIGGIVEYGMRMSLDQIAAVALASAYGAALIFLTTAICILWLRACGWSCQQTRR